MARTRHRLNAQGMARNVAMTIGQEVALARMNHGLSVRAAARLAGVAPETQRRVEGGDPSVQLATGCAVASALGLKVWGRAYPVTTPTLRDTGQLWVAEWLRRQTSRAWSIQVEVSLGNLRAADVVFSGPTEIIDAEIERLLADFQAQFRAADEKRNLLSDMHQRPVRLVIAVEDTMRNRQVVKPHLDLMRSRLPAGSREVLAALRSGTPLGRDGLLWVRRRRG